MNNNNKEYFKSCLSKATIAILYFDNFYAEPLFIQHYRKDEHFEDNTWMLVPNAMVGVCITFTDEDIAKATIDYNEEEDAFDISFVNQEDMCEENYKYFKRIKFCYLKNAL